MTTYKKISINEVLSDILLELPSPPTSQELFKIKRFIQKACKELKVNNILSKKIVKLPIENHRTILPNDIIDLISVWRDEKIDDPLNDKQPNTPFENYEVNDYDVYYNKYRLEPASNDYNYLPEWQYTLRGDILFVGDSKLENIYIKYSAPEIDCDGYWLIPDSEHLKEAIYWYVVMKLLAIGKTISNFSHQYAQQQFEKIYAPRAISHLKRYTTEDAERNRRLQTRLIWNYDRWNMFGNMEDERINFNIDGKYTV